MYKYSIFNVFSPEFNGKRIIYNSLKGKMILINNQKIFVKYIAKNVIPKEDDILGIFKDSGIIVDRNINEIDAVIAENKQAIKNRTTLSFIIFPSSNCQLGCVYCGQVHSKIKMKENLYDKITQKIEQLITNKEHLHIGWFGGEPLLGIDTIEKLTPELKKIAYRNNCTYSASTTTNGLLLNEKNFLTLLKNNITDITVSIDGIGAYHDERRPTKGGNGTYDIIMSNLKSLFAYVKHHEVKLSNFMIRINVDKYNKEGVEPLLVELKNIGCQEIVSSWDIAPIHSWGNDAQKRALNEEEFADFNLDMTFKLLELKLLDKIPLPKRTRIVCQAVNDDSYYIDAMGQVYDCSEYPLIKDCGAHTIGDISDEISSLNRKRKFNHWDEQIRNYPCYKCNLLPVCAGGCPKAWRENYDACPTYKHNIGEYLILSYLSAKENIYEI